VKSGRGEEGAVEEFQVENPIVSFANPVLADFPPEKGKLKISSSPLLPFLLF
jgi:hypothetical protein